MDVFDWIERNLSPAWSDTGAPLYEGMDSQSDRSLPIVYEPFDAAKRAHWADRGATFDYLASTGGGRLLDLGPGDGWPSLPVAPFVEEVVGVDAVPTLADVARTNAARLGIENVRSVVIEPGQRLPFPDASFDGAMAASSLEQTPDPRATLGELRRVLRPGGRLRLYYEALGPYRGGRERQGWLRGRTDGTSLLFLSDYRPDEERARHVRLTLLLPETEVGGRVRNENGAVDVARITPTLLEGIRTSIADARGCRLTHASGATLVRWMREVGFREARPTHAGNRVAAELFDAWDAGRRPMDLAGVDAVVRPVATVAAGLPAPIENDPMITAVR